LVAPAGVAPAGDRDTGWVRLFAHHFSPASEALWTGAAVTVTIAG
jgi:hypothetical protein